MAFEHRPTFGLESRRGLEDVQSALARALSQAGLEARWARPPQPGAAASAPSNHLVVTFPEAQRHFWSPWLALDLASRDDGGTRLFGRFSPHPAVWTAWAFSYLGLGVVAFFSAVFGTCQCLLESPATALWGVASCAVVATALFVSSRMGQRLAREQMRRLGDVVSAAVSG